MRRRFEVAIAGEINLDLILYGTPESMPVEREILASGLSLTLGSSSAILAHNLAVLGVDVSFTTRVGSDPLGAIALARLSEANVDLSRVVKTTGGTDTGVTVILPHGRERHMFTYPGTMAELALGNLDMDYLAEADHFHLSSLFLQTGLRPDVPELFTRLKAAGMTISLDTNDDPDDRWEGLMQLLPLVDVFLPNESEACRITGKGTAEEAIEVLGRTVPLVAVKCGTRGALVRCEGKTVAVPPVAVVPVDTVGAGDSFNAGFLYGYVRGLSPELAAKAGNICGAFSTLRPGGTEAFRDAVLGEAFFDEHPLPEAQ